MKKRCVLYYNRGSKCIIKLLVSIVSLQKHYDGDIVVLLEGKNEKYLIDRLRQLNVIIKEVEEHKVRNPLAVKPSLYKHVPEYKLVVYLDSDTLVSKPIDELFYNVRKYGLVFTQFCNWKTNVRGSIQRRIKACEPVFGKEHIKKAIKYGKAVNTGVWGFSNGYVQSTDFFDVWFEKTLEMQEKNIICRMVDELAAQCLLHVYKHKMLDQRFNYSVKHATIPIGEAVVTHSHGYKSWYKGEYPVCDLNIKQYMELVNSGFISINDVFTDRRLKHATWRKNKGWKV